MHNITDADVQKRDHGTYDLHHLLVFYIFYSPKIHDYPIPAPIQFKVEKRSEIFLIANY